MSLLKFVHAADLHLDSPFRGIGSEVPDHVLETLREATFEAYDRMVELCISEEVDAFLIAGDVYDGADRSLRAQVRFVNGLNRLDAAGVRSYICHGNHDPIDGWEARLLLPSGCVRFGADVGAEPVFPDDPDRAVVHGISFPTSVVRENLALRFQDVSTANTNFKGKFNIGLLHANVGGNNAHQNYAPCTVEDLVNTAVDYWALGHVHTRQVLRDERPAIVYPGNPQGRHPRETGTHGVYLVEVADNGSPRLEFIETDVVRWEMLTLEIDTIETQQELMDAMEGIVAASVKAVEGRPVVYRLDLFGRGPLHRWLSLPENSMDLHTWLNELYSDQNPWMWCERIKVRTGTSLDREREAQRDDFVGDLLRTGSAFRDDPKQLSELQSSLKPLYVTSSAGSYLRGFLPSLEEIRSLLTEAEDQCLNVLAEEEDLK